MHPDVIRALMRNGMDQRTIQRLSLGARPDSPFEADATPFFDRCEDGIMSIHHGGRMGLFDLMPWEVTDDFHKDVKYLTYVRPAMSEGSATAGHLSDPCVTPNGYEFGTADITLSDFGRYGRSGPTREILKPERFCMTSPRYDLDGNMVTSEFEWDLLMAMDVLKQDLFRHIITGNDGTAGQFDGLQQWINTGYASSMLNSTVIDWNGNDLDGNGGGTITINGVNYTGGADLVDFLLALYRRFQDRIQWSPMLATQDQREGDIILVLPSFLARCLLDKYTCWSVCEGRQYNEANLQTFEARTFRNSLLGGMFGGGAITLDGDRVHLFPYNWETMHGTQRGDIYFMTMGVGSQRLWQGQHLDAAKAATTLREEGITQYFTRDGGRILGTSTVDNLCRQTSMWWRGRLWNQAPWLQARIMEVECDPILSPLSEDPLESSFYPLTSFGGDTATV